jgi:ferrochelatase
MPGRVAVVLMNLGGPDSPAAVRPFLRNLFSDPAIIPLPAAARLPLAALIASLRAKSARANYGHMGGASPLLPETQAQADMLEGALKALNLDARVFVAMRYWRPFSEDAAEAVRAWNPDQVLLLPLYPQYSTSTTASSIQAWTRAWRGSQRAICCYPELDGLIAAHVNRIRQCWDAAGRPEGVRLLLSAHGVPLRNIAAGDPYQEHVERTCAAIVERLDWPWDWRICYQSRVGPMKWLGPSTPEAIQEACRDGMGVLIDPVAFVSEHVETLVELDRDYAALAKAAGCRIYLRAAAVGTEPAFIAGLTGLVTAALDRSALGPGGAPCQGSWAGCPLKARRAA